MKYRVVFKTPGGIDCTLDSLDKESEEYAKVKQLFDKYIKYSELICIEFDTETMTAKVIERN